MADIPLGTITATGELFTIAHETLRQHVYIIGKTGGGKSTLLESMILADIRAGRCLCVIDPHGTLAYKIAGAVGEIQQGTNRDRVNDTILFDPLATHVPAFNLCREDTDTELATRVDNISAALQHIFHDAWGNRMEDCLKNALFIAIENNLSLADIPKILNDETFRSSLTCNNLAVADYWSQEYATYTDNFRDQVISPILNKLRAFDSNPLLKRVVDDENMLDIPAIMGNPEKRAHDGRLTPRAGKILLVALSKRMGAKPSHVLGSLLVSRIAQAALERETLPEEQRRDFRLYIDEFQNFTSEAMAEILAEARKYRLSLVLCHQYREQIRDKNLREAVLASASTLIVFRVGATDADAFAAELGLKDQWGQDRPALLTELPNYQAYVKTMSGPYPTKAELIQTIPQALPTGSLKRVQKNTQSRYTRPN